jgi:uracil phosphoribosyltransferase
VLLTLIASPSGLRAIYNAFPRVRIVTSAIDQGLNERFHIIPGIGNMGGNSTINRQYEAEVTDSIERYFGT